MVEMNGQPQLIPGIVRKASTSLQTKPSCNVNHHAPKPYPQNGIIPGSIRPVAPKACFSKAPIAVVPATSKCKPSNTDQLTTRAVEEILQETQRGKQRAEQHGSTAWRPCPLRKTNKRFLNRTLQSMVQHNQRVKQETTHRSQLKLTELVRSGNEPTRERSKAKDEDSSSNTDGSHSSVIDLAEDSD